MEEITAQNTSKKKKYLPQQELELAATINNKTSIQKKSDLENNMRGRERQLLNSKNQNLKNNNTILTQKQ